MAEKNNRFNDESSKKMGEYCGYEYKWSHFERNFALCMNCRKNKISAFVVLEFEGII